MCQLEKDELLRHANIRLTGCLPMKQCHDHHLFSPNWLTFTIWLRRPVPLIKAIGISSRALLKNSASSLSERSKRQLVSNGRLSA